MGEAALPPVAPAIGNAIANALGGIRIRDLPISRTRLLPCSMPVKRGAKLPITISTTINGEQQELMVKANQTLLECLRDDLSLKVPSRAAAWVSAALAPFWSMAGR